MTNEHRKNKRPSNLEKHQGGKSRTKSDKVNSLWKGYKANGGKLSKSAWQRANMPPRD